MNKITDVMTNWIERQARPCNHCLEIKDFTSFHKNKSCRSGVHTICRDCRGIQGSQYQLGKAIENGEDVSECTECEILFKSKRFSKCRTCRSK